MEEIANPQSAWNGALKLDDGLATGKLRVPFFDKEIEIDLTVVVGERDGATDDQLASISDCLSRFSDLQTLASRAILTEYLKTIDLYRDFAVELGEDPDKMAPRITSSDQLRELIGLQELYIPYSGRIGTFGLSFWCSWEVEHGLGVSFDGWTVAKVGDASATTDCDSSGRTTRRK